ncbi:MAG: STAS domain-containing protein [Fibrobacteres bacterium]|nr:STAS domain-containing protein [Fibrobacterota bacterium]
MSQLNIARKEVGEFIVFKLKGALIVSTMLSLKQEVSQLLEKGLAYIAFDLGGIEVIDSSGLGLLSNIKRRADEKNGHCVLMSLPPIVADGLQQTGLIENLVIVKNEAEFRESFIL